MAAWRAYGPSGRSSPSARASAASPRCTRIRSQRERSCARRRIGSPEGPTRAQPRRLKLHQRDEPVDLGLARSELREDAPEPQRLVAQLRARPRGALRRGVPLVEHEVDDREHGGEASGELGPARHLEGDARLGERSLRANDALGDRRPALERAVLVPLSPCMSLVSARRKQALGYRLTQGVVAMPEIAAPASSTPLLGLIDASCRQKVTRTCSGTPAATSFERGGTPDAFFAGMSIIASNVPPAERTPDRTSPRRWSNHKLEHHQDSRRMRIADFLHQDAVIADIAGWRPEAALAELCRPLEPEVDFRKVLQALLEREKRGSTGIGDGVAIPHARIAGLPGLRATFGRSRSGLDFGAIDGRPCHFFFTLFVPEASLGVQMVGVQIGGIQVKALARICSLFSEAAFRDAVLTARDHHRPRHRDLPGDLRPRP